MAFETVEILDQDEPPRLLIPDSILLGNRVDGRATRKDCVFIAGTAFVLGRMVHALATLTARQI